MENQLYYRVLDEGIIDFGVLVNFVENMEIVNLQFAQYFELYAENVDVCDIREYFLFCSARNEGVNESLSYLYVVGFDNVIFERSCIVFFTFYIFIFVYEVFEFFERVGFSVFVISCMQRNQRGEILVIFRIA